MSIKKLRPGNDKEVHESSSESSVELDASEPQGLEEEYEPVLVYRSPGPHQAPGGTFKYMQIRDPKTGEAALEDGWHLTIEAAVKAGK